MIKNKVIYYKDELNDEFSTAKIIPRKIDENYKYIHKNIIWNICAFIIQNVLSVPIKYLYAKIKFRVEYIGKEKLKPYKRKGYFIYNIKVNQSCEKNEKQEERLSEKTYMNSFYKYFVS